MYCCTFYCKKCIVAFCLGVHDLPIAVTVTFATTSAKGGPENNTS